MGHASETAPSFSRGRVARRTRIDCHPRHTPRLRTSSQVSDYFQARVNYSGLLAHQHQEADGILSALTRHRAALDGSDLGIGKCLGLDVPVMMSDGRIVANRNVVAGDSLMGEDGTPRRVLSVSNGAGPMFRITPCKGEPWTCNEDHILVLVSTGNHVKGWTRGEEKEISVRDFLKIGKAERTQRWKLFRSRGWDWPEVPTDYDPYIYGLWLGDGSVGQGALCSSSDDPELSAAWTSYFESLGQRVHFYQDLRTKAQNFTPREGPWREWIQTSQHRQEKFIRPEFLCNSRANRLKLLAGLLDTDGYLCQGLNAFEFVSMWSGLAGQVAFLARSLGFLVTERLKPVKGVTYYRLFISGQTAAIPTKSPRRRASVRPDFKSVGVSGFVIEPIGVGLYKGVVLDGNRRFLLGDGTVTHNTYAAAAAIRHLDVPTLVVAPLVAKEGWRRAALHMQTSYSVSHYEALRLGKTPYGRWEFPLPEGGLNYFYRCSMCQRKLDLRVAPTKCPYHPVGIHCIEKIKPEHNYGKFFWHENIKQLVFDEIHRCSALDSLQADMLVAAKRQRIATLGLSATVAESPLDLRALGFALGLHNYTDFYKWAARNGCRRLPPLPGVRFAVGAERQKGIMADIHAEIFPERGVRVRIADLPAGTFPDVQITAELYDLSDPGLLAELYERMDSAIAAFNAGRAGDLDGDSPLTSLLRAREEAELLKVPILVELGNDAKSQGYSVAYFVNFRRTVDELCARLKTTCRVDGSQTGPGGAKRRQANIDRFQCNSSRDIVLSQAAGSASLSIQDEHGGFPRLGLVIPGVSAQQTRQLCGRLRRATGKSKSFYRFVLAAGTVEEKTHKSLSASLNNMDALNDCDLWAANLPLTNCNINDIFDPTKD